MGKSKFDRNHSGEQVSNLLIGAAAGSVLGATTALLFAPESGEELRQDICDAYCDASDKAKGIAHQVIDRANETAKGASPFLPRRHSHSNRNLLIGALGGTLLGVTAYLLLNSKEGDIGTLAGKIKRVKHSAKKNLNSWMQTANEVVQSLSQHIEGQDEDEDEDEHPHQGSNLMDWAIFGLKLLQNVKRRR